MSKPLSKHLLKAISESIPQGPPNALHNQVSSWVVGEIREIKKALDLSCRKLQDTHANCPEDCDEEERFKCPESEREGSRGLECWREHFLKKASVT